MGKRATAAAAGLMVLTGCSGGGGQPAPTASATPAAAVDAALIDSAVAHYRTWVERQVDATVATTARFTDAVRDGDLASAQDRYAPSRVGWERIEPIAGLVEQIDGATDARVDDFAGVDDPEFTGWHRLEYLLFRDETTRGITPFADGLDADLRTLAEQIGSVDITPTAMAVGASELIEEVSLGKLTGEENRYAKTDLWDIEANLDGSAKVVRLLTPALEQADPDLLAAVSNGFDAVRSTLEPLRDGDGWQLYCLADDEYPSPRCPKTTVDRAAVQTLQAQLAGLSESTSQVAGALGLA